MQPVDDLTRVAMPWVGSWTWPAPGTAPPPVLDRYDVVLRIPNVNTVLATNPADLESRREGSLSIESFAMVTAALAEPGERLVLAYSRDELVALESIGHVDLTTGRTGSVSVDPGIPWDATAPLDLDGFALIVCTGTRDEALLTATIEAASLPIALLPAMGWGEDGSWLSVSPPEDGCTYLGTSETLARRLLSAPGLHAQRVQQTRTRS